MNTVADGRILVTVKTYPTLSRKYGETVCTAGLREDGSWVRIYPVPFRSLHEHERYSKFDWISCPLVRNAKDPRPESYHPVDIDDLRPTGHMGTDKGWRDRRQIVLRTAKVYDRLDLLIDEAKSYKRSLAVFKPNNIRDLIWEEEDPEWDQDKLRQMLEDASQPSLFADDIRHRQFKIIPKLPYSFSYRFADVAGKNSELQILDWEIGALYWNCLSSCGGDKEGAIEKVRHKYIDDFMKKDLHFFLGTTQRWQSVAPNPWVIVGVFPIPHEEQIDLFG